MTWAEANREAYHHQETTTKKPPLLLMPSNTNKRLPKFLRISCTDFDERRVKGLCHWCGETYGEGHQCEKKWHKFYVIEVEDDAEEVEEIRKEEAVSDDATETTLATAQPTQISNAVETESSVDLDVLDTMRNIAEIKVFDQMPDRMETITIANLDGVYGPIDAAVVFDEMSVLEITKAEEPVDTEPMISSLVGTERVRANKDLVPRCSLSSAFSRFVLLPCHAFIDFKLFDPGIFKHLLDANGLDTIRLRVDFVHDAADIFMKNALEFILNEANEEKILLSSTAIVDINVMKAREDKSLGAIVAKVIDIGTIALGKVESGGVHDSDFSLIMLNKVNVKVLPVLHIHFLNEFMSSHWAIWFIFELRRNALLGSGLGNSIICGGGGSKAILDSLDDDLFGCTGMQKLDSASKHENSKAVGSGIIWDVDRLGNLSFQLSGKKLVVAFDGICAEAVRATGTSFMLNLVDPLLAAASSIEGTPSFGRLNGDTYICRQCVISDTIRNFSAAKDSFCHISELGSVDMPVETSNSIVLSNAVSIQIALLNLLGHLVSMHWYRNPNLSVLRQINLVQHLLVTLQRGDVEVLVLGKLIVLLGVILEDGFLASELENVVRFVIMTFNPSELIPQHKIMQEYKGKHVTVRNMFLEMLIDLQVTIKTEEMLEQWHEIVSSDLITYCLNEAVHPTSMRWIMILLDVCLASFPTFALKFRTSGGYQGLMRVLFGFYDSPDIYHILFCLIFGKPVYPRLPAARMQDLHVLMPSDGGYIELKFVELLESIIVVEKSICGERKDELLQHLFSTWLKGVSADDIMDPFEPLKYEKSLSVLKMKQSFYSILEIEPVLLHYPAIVECCVFGLSDKAYWEAAFAILVLDIVTFKSVYWQIFVFEVDPHLFRLLVMRKRGDEVGLYLECAARLRKLEGTLVKLMIKCNTSRRHLNSLLCIILLKEKLILINYQQSIDNMQDNISNSSSTWSFYGFCCFGWYIMLHGVSKGERADVQLKDSEELMQVLKFHLERAQFRTKQQANKQVLMQWKGSLPEDATWENLYGSQQ